jgi:MoCo/4Fe-4S cofactor protein with predicted Tat translocation signal
MKEPLSLDLEAVRRRLATTRGKEYWRSLEELAQTPEFDDFVAREFPRLASEWDEGVSRRRFLELAGASLALGGLTACTRQPVEAIVPYVKQPEEILPGLPLFFATAMDLSGYATGLLVESHTGRPTKIEGNPDHSASLGATDVFAQAAVLGLYDPDRSQVITKLGEIRTWEAFLAELDGRLVPHRALQGEGLRILTGTVGSPTLADQLRGLLTALPKARWHQWEPAGRDAARGGAALAFSQSVETRYDFSKAAVVLSLDADPFTFGPGHLVNARAFARRRREAVTSGASGLSAPRFYAIESAPTSSGTLADHRLPLPGRKIPAAALALAAELGIGAARPSGLRDGETAWIAAATADLRAAGPAALIVPGEFAPAEVHALAHAMNQKLGNGGTTVLTTESVVAEPADQLRSLAALVADMTAGTVDTLIILGGNPVFDAPADLAFKDALLKVGVRVHLSPYDDETSQYCQWHIPEAHFLEAWSDARAWDGTAGIVQPLIEPLYGGKSAHELLAVVAGSPASAADLVKARWQKQWPGPGFNEKWRKALHDGFVAGTALPHRPFPLAGGGVQKAVEVLAALSLQAPAEGTLELVFRPDPGIHDGRFANNGWLQELPRPLSKLTWDNAAHLSVATAARLGVKSEDVLLLTVGERTLEAPVWVQPGQPDDSITLHFGHGRTRAGRVGSGTGVNAYALRTSAAPWLASASVQKTSLTWELATTQTHFNMEGRQLVRTGTLGEYRAEPDFVGKMGEVPAKDMSLYPPHPYEHHAWGLAVNLSSCTGCNACVVACQSENNIAVVGKDQVRRGREMQWIRIDRYYEGDPADPLAHDQPVMCMHCEKAPCEVVCPVAATTHSEEGINEMTYNRCIGTKYCSNNCPYKVRRFNFYDYNKDKHLPSLTLLANPNVTVRQRGVMEKCNYCIQRVNRARMNAEKENRRVRDGEAVTACQQVCPTEALVFGDVNDPTSRVTKLKAEKLNYGLLEELNTRPRTSYLAKLTNPNEKLAKLEKKA